MGAESSHKELSFEQLMQELASISESLASDEDGLEAAVAKYEKGVAVAKECLSRLDKAEQRVMQIKEGMDPEAS